MREGAVQYKQWLRNTLKQKGKSIEALLPLLDADESLPAEMQLDPQQALGARFFRIKALKLYKARGAFALEQILTTSQ